MLETGFLLGEYTQTNRNIGIDTSNFVAKHAILHAISMLGLMPCYWLIKGGEL
jgi:hypothetical protein